jgi:hypothetical protein
VKLFKVSSTHVDATEDVAGLARIFGCKVSSLPMKYLGLPSRASFKPKSIWMVLLRRWNVVWLVVKSKGGRITLIKSILSDMVYLEGSQCSKF